MTEDDLDGLMARLAATPARLKRADLTGARQRFEIKRRLGSGSFGDVYEARDRNSGAIVGLKALKSSRPDWLHRFKREFRSVADLAHPNVIRVYELFCAMDQWYMTMELVDGLPFDEHLARAPEQFESCFRQLASAIEALHDTECVHCDIKPSNALVERSGRVVLLDFGLARSQRAMHHTAVAGTPHYMPPECGLGDPPSEAGDWYAFGVILYEALTGRPAFAGTDAELMSLKLKGVQQCVPEARPDADPKLCDLAVRLLSPVVSERPGGPEVVSLLSGETGLHALQLPVVDTGPFVGRDRELAILDEALEQSAHQEVLVAISGPAGIGKSTLVHAFSRRVRERGVAVYEGRCHEAEAVAYTGLDGAIDMLCSDLRTRKDLDVGELVSEEAQVLPLMFPVLRRLEAFSRARGDVAAGLTPLELRRMASRGLCTLFTRLAAYQPVVLFIDDFHWATDDAARLLLDLLTPPAPPIVTVISYDESAVGRALALDGFLTAVDHLTLPRFDIEVSPLERDHVAALVAARAGSTLDVDYVVAETGGDPYLLSLALDVDDDQSQPTTDLSIVFRNQLAELSQAERQLLELVCVAAAPLTQNAACVASGLRDWSPVAIDRLRREKLIRCLGQGRDGMVEPYHERVRETALTSITDEQHRALHLRLARFLETRARVEPELLAHHYRCAGARDQARSWAQQAARDAARSLAFSRAGELYRSAVELAHSNDDKIALMVELCDTLAAAGRRADAGRVSLEAAELLSHHPSDRFSVAELRARAGEHLMLSGLFADGLELIREALAAVSVALPESSATAVAETINLTAELATRGIGFTPRDETQVSAVVKRRLALELATARALAFTDVRAQWISARALLDALESGLSQQIQRAMSHFAFANLARAPDHPLVIDALDAAQRLAERSRDDVGLGFASMARGMFHVQRMEHRAAVELLRDAARRFATSGRRMAREASIARVLVGLVCGNYGVDVRHAQQVRERCEAEAEELEDRFILNWVRLLGSWVDLSLDDPQAAATNLAKARAAWPNVQDDLFVATSLMHEISIELYARPETAWDAIREAETRFHALFTSLVPVPRAMFYRHWGFAAVVAFQLGKAGRDETIARLQQCAKVLESLPYIRSLQAVVRAHVAALSGDRHGAATELAAAARVWDEGGQRGPALLSRLRLHQLLGETDVAESTKAELREFGAGDPDRYGYLFVGPRLGPSLD